MFNKTQKSPKKPDHSYLGLALAGNMITPDEHQAVLRGEAEIGRIVTLDENSHGLAIRMIKKLPNGNTAYQPMIRLYHNRCDDIMIARLLGED